MSPFLGGAASPGGEVEGRGSFSWFRHHPRFPRTWYGHIPSISQYGIDDSAHILYLSLVLVHVFDLLFDGLFMFILVIITVNIELSPVVQI